MRQFLSYSWPGNVRELERMLEYAYIFVKGPVIFPSNLPALDELMRERLAETGLAGPHRKAKGLEKDLLHGALERAGGRRLEAATLLGISRTSLWRKMKMLDIN